MAELIEKVRKLIRRWLGIAAIQRQVRDLEGQVAVSSADLERLNAATSRIAARVNSLLDQIDVLGTGNDDEVRAQAQLDAVLESSAQLRPVLEQLEALGADATNPVPEPEPEQVPVEPGPDVPPVENAGDGETGENVPPAEPVEEPAPADGGTVVPAEEAPDAGGDTAPGPDEVPVSDDVPVEERRDNS
ncbi:MAG: hypothetical protein WC054_01130 [Candidatus Nanopelagicales bacterium]